MNKIDFKTFKRRFFVDYSFLLEKLKNNNEKTNENNNNLNINNKENHLEMKRNILGRKKKSINFHFYFNILYLISFISSLKLYNLQRELEILLILSISS